MIPWANASIEPPVLGWRVVTADPPRSSPEPLLVWNGKYLQMARYLADSKTSDDGRFFSTGGVVLAGIEAYWSVPPLSSHVWQPVGDESLAASRDAHYMVWNGRYLQIAIVLDDPKIRVRAPIGVFATPCGIRLESVQKYARVAFPYQASLHSENRGGHRSPLGQSAGGASPVNPSRRVDKWAA